MRGKGPSNRGAPKGEKGPLKREGLGPKTDKAKNLNRETEDPKPKRLKNRRAMEETNRPSPKGAMKSI